MDRDARLNRILEMLAVERRLSVREAAGALQVSEATVRRDLDELAGQQLLRRTRGGAASSGIAYDLPLRYKASRRASEKQRIGLAAAKRVHAGEVVGLNGGTTTTEVARALAGRVDLGGEGPSDTRLTVVTNALNIATELTVRPHTKIVVTGGVCRPQSYELTGPLATGVLEQVSLDIVFLGVNAVDPAGGASCHHEGEASTNHLMVERSESVAVVTDSTKLGARAFSRICGIERIDVLITDGAADPTIVQRFRDAGVEVVLV
jgi:DeoR family transcriptional regulator, aga operon transcriptional repressor